MTTNEKIDLTASGLLTPEETTFNEPLQEDEDLFLKQIDGFMNSIQDSLAVMHINHRVMVERVATLERFVSYLLEKDPEMKKKMQENKAPEVDKKSE